MPINAVSSYRTAYQPSVGSSRAQESKASLLSADERCDSYEESENDAVTAALSQGCTDYDFSVSGSGDSLSSVLSVKSKSIILIDPRFYAKLSEDSDLADEYAKEIENMRRIDKQFEAQAKANGATVLSRGWYIDKDGGISSWSVVKTENKSKGFLEKMSDNLKKIKKKKAKKAKEQKKLEETREKRKEQLLQLKGEKQAAQKAKLKRKSRKTSVYDIRDITPKKKKESSSVSVSFSTVDFKA